MWQWVKRNPWVWIVFFFLFVLGMNLAFVMLAVWNRPILVD
jgi:hypothetical protein